MEKLKFLVVNNYSRFASKDVFDCTFATLRQDFGYEVLPFAIDMLQAFFSADVMQKYMTATAVSVNNNFTHVIFVGSAMLNPWVIPTINRCGVKTIYWSMEDPHALDQNIKFLNQADYYFSNEKNVADRFESAYYLPTAGGHTTCLPPTIPLHQLKKEVERDPYSGIDVNIFDNEVVFCGNIYPNRKKILEALIPDFEKHKIRFGTLGIVNLMEDGGKSPIWNYVKAQGVVDHKQVIMAYGYSKFVINIEREFDYEYNTKFSSNKKYKIKGRSLNPRAYEVALTGGGLQLIDEKREEIFDKGVLEPGKHCVTYKNPKDLIDKILYYREHEDERKKIVYAAREHALVNHTYRSRMKRMMAILDYKEGRKKELTENLISSLGIKKN